MLYVNLYEKSNTQLIVIWKKLVGMKFVIFDRVNYTLDFYTQIYGILS